MSMDLEEEWLGELLLPILKDAPKQTMSRREMATALVQKYGNGLPPFFGIAVKVGNREAQDQLIRGALFQLGEGYRVDRLENTGADSQYKLVNLLDSLARASAGDEKDPLVPKP